MTKSQARYSNLSASSALSEGHEGYFARTMILTIFMAILTIFVWAAATPVNEITTGGGTIKTRASAEQVEHPDGGVVVDIMVASGDTVDAGEPILRFDTSSLMRELEKLKARLNALTAERRRIDFVLSGENDLLDSEILSELATEELLFWVEQSYLEAQLDLIDADSRAILLATDMTAVNQDSLRRELQLLEARLSRTQQGQKVGAITLNSVEAIEREYLQLQRVLLEAQSDAVAKQSELEANELRKAEVVARRNREAALRRAEVDEQIVTAEQTIAEIHARIDRATVRATVTGTVMQLAVSNPSEVVAPGDLIARIIPGRDHVEAEIEISADNIGSVQIGMAARLKILSYDFTRYGEIEGKVQSISASSYQDELGSIVYRVTIALPDQGRSARLANRPILPGMTVTADILSDSRPILSYLLKPLRALSDRAFTEA